jgi:hypothetical protein
MPNGMGAGMGQMSMGMHEGTAGLTNLIGSFFQDNPYAKMQDIYGRYQGYLNPYIEAGKSGLGTISGLVSDPTALEDRIMSHYQMSPHAQFQQKQLTDAANAMAARGGIVGTPQEQEGMARQLQGLISGDQQQYLQGAMQPFEFGLGQQLGAGRFGVGQEGNYLENMANLAGGRTQWENQLAQSRAGDIGSIMNSFGDVGMGGAQAAGSMFGGGIMGLL